MLISEIPELEDIIDDFDSIVSVEINSCEIMEIYESCLNIIDEFLSNNIIEMKNEKFEIILQNYVFANLRPLLELCLDNKTEIDNIMIDIYDMAYDYYFMYVLIPRSYSKSYIRKKYNIDKMTNKVQYLKDCPQPTQRTDEWYSFRSKLLTASSIWKVWGSDSVKNQLIYDKCIPFNSEKYNSFNTESPLHHGQKYEQLSVMYYEEKFNTKIEDFGCIKHNKYPFIGASPDGINTDAKNNRFGRMLEIKNIVNREITGIPKEEYWIQMQLQMETCDLDECDFLETHFIEYENEEEFLKDDTDKLKGLIVYFIKENKPLYEYMPIHIKEYSEMMKWENEVVNKYEDLTWMKTIYWKLEKVSCVLVCRNKLWFNYALKDIENIWNIIEKERNGNYSHRAPKKSVKKNVHVEEEENKIKNCLIDDKLFKNITVEGCN